MPRSDANNQLSVLSLAQKKDDASILEPETTREHATPERFRTVTEPPSSSAVQDMPSSSSTAPSSSTAKAAPSPSTVQVVSGSLSMPVRDRSLSPRSAARLRIPDPLPPRPLLAGRSLGGGRSLKDVINERRATDASLLGTSLVYAPKLELARKKLARDIGTPATTPSKPDFARDDATKARESSRLLKELLPGLSTNSSTMPPSRSVFIKETGPAGQGRPKPTLSSSISASASPSPSPGKPKSKGDLGDIKKIMAEAGRKQHSGTVSVAMQKSTVPPIPEQVISDTDLPEAAKMHVEKDTISSIHAASDTSVSTADEQDLLMPDSTFAAQAKRLSSPQIVETIPLSQTHVANDRARSVTSEQDLVSSNTKVTTQAKKVSPAQIVESTLVSEAHIVSDLPQSTAGEQGLVDPKTKNTTHVEGLSPSAERSRKRSRSSSQSSSNQRSSRMQGDDDSRSSSKRPRIEDTHSDNLANVTSAEVSFSPKQGRCSSASSRRSCSRSSTSTVDPIDILAVRSDDEQDPLLEQPHSPVSDLTVAVDAIAIIPKPVDVNRYFVERDYGLQYKLARDLPHELQDEINATPEWAQNPDVLHQIFESTIRNNTTHDEPEAPYIRVINNVDEEATPKFEFYYTNFLWHADDVPPPEYASLKGCDCIGKCDPNSKTCACLKRQREAFVKGGYDLNGFIYNEKGRLRVEGFPIFECNDACGCTDDCRNRVVQNGRKCHVDIVKTAKKGWGVFASKKIPKGTFIGIYSGELLAEEEAEERGMVYNKVGRTYLFDIDFWYLPQDAARYCVDAFHAGNFTRFLNHSCDPNCRINACHINDACLEKALLTIFSLKDINAGEELCFSYAGDEGDDDKGQTAVMDSPGKKATKQTDEVYRKCECGAPNCRGVLFSASDDESESADGDEE
ncbi:hypothetical protein DFH11DRAFT_1561071 [Phellopilus nigrolimitatus]|nr:hypothetical protein DFH11DRAFT_1561071 [Phellopilus nigrolimitatus]